MVKKGEEYVPERGDIVWMQFSPRLGHEQGGRRPSLILSPREFNLRTSFIFCCPITSQVKKYPFEVLISVGTIKGVVLADQSHTLDWRARAPSFIARAPESVVSRVGEIVSMLARGE